jgi:VanZ family protein
MRLSWALITVAYCAAIFWLSNAPRDPLPQYRFPGRDKVAHAVIYGGLAAVVSQGIRRRGKPVSPAVQFWAPVVFAGLYGLSDELHQSFVPGRSADALDLLVNVSAALIVQYWLCVRRWRIAIRTP